MHIRSRLRESRCLIFLSTNDSVHSKWIPWELEFFDVRWGSPTVGLYIHDASKSRKRRRRAPKSNANEAAESSQTTTIQEYLDIYRRVTDKTLPAVSGKPAAFFPTAADVRRMHLINTA